ncbi:MAG: FAD-binding protein, partial [Candidatus Marinimicrobia bacterium]|nr:FAD-binding protein [Candidatus Neomarinimicrobiota bacterium]
MYDAIIVGAGPAGTTAALYAHRLGLQCILLDKSIFPRDKICGDALSGK